jgi:hypothetical protein
MIGNIDKSTNKVSTYTPSSEVRAFTAQVKKDYNIGHQILNKTWTELNNSSVIDDMNRGRLMFNAFVDESYEDPSESWKWRGTRSKARNKGIAMHANLTAAYMMPTFKAQNDASDIDREVSEFMTDLVEWMAQDENSNYKENFLSLVFAMESDPIVYLGAEYQEVMQTIKIKGEDGKLTKKEVMDEVLSGFKAPIYTADQILISNPFERNLQKHRHLGKRRWITYEEAEAKYKDHPYWDSVKAGNNVVYNEDDGLFYDIKDEDHEDLVEEYTPMYRRDDTEVCFIGGVYMGDLNVDNNPIKHRDNFGAPRYNVQHFGFYPIGSHFLFYKSMMNTMRWDNALYDASTEIMANRAMLDAEMPVAVSGSDEIDSSIMFPNAVVAFKDQNTKITPLMPPSQLGNIMQSLNLTEDSMSEGSVSETVSGQLPAASQKAYSVSQAQANSKKIIGGVAKGLALSISKYGLLMADIAINNLSTAQVEDIVGDEVKLKYRNFILNNKDVGGKRMSKKLMFDESLIGKEMSEDEKRNANLDLYAESEKSEMSIMRANPEMIAKMKYFCTADYKELFAQSDEMMQAMLTNLYGILRQDPLVNPEELVQELMYSYFKSKGSRFINKNPAPPQPGMEGQGSSLGNQIMQKQLTPAIASIGNS